MSRSAAEVSYHPFQMFQRFILSRPRNCIILVGMMFFRRRWSRRERRMSSVSWERIRNRRRERFLLSITSDW